MTSIAWDGKTLAVDRKSSEGASMYRVYKKIVEVPGGYAACCGNVAQIHHFLRWFKAGRKKAPPTLDDFGAIVVANGKVSIWEGDSEIPCDRTQKLAMGCGWMWAAAAMDHGKNAIEAIEYASTRDNYTGGGVDSVKMGWRK